MFEFSKYIFFISLWFITNLALSQTAAHDSLGFSKKDQLFIQDKQSESLQNKYKRHITTLDFISRKTDNNKYFLNLAKRNNWFVIDCIENGVMRSIEDIHKEIVETLITEFNYDE